MSSSTKSLGNGFWPVTTSWDMSEREGADKQKSYPERIQPLGHGGRSMCGGASCLWSI